MGAADSVPTFLVPARRLMPPVAAVMIAAAFVWLADMRWNVWMGSASSQATDDAEVRVDITRLATRVSGQVRAVAVTDFQRVRAGDVLVEIDQDKYLAAVAQAEACAAAARAALGQSEQSGRATIRHDSAGRGG
jgi:membrane fusion protein, multidrug efflux system